VGVDHKNGSNSSNARAISSAKEGSMKSEFIA
jgi:hypothetical protein